MIEKILVDEFEILENEGQLGISLQLNEEPIETGEFVYDGRNCGILIRNGNKAYIFTNIVEEVRSKLLNSAQLMMIEQNGEDIVNSYMCDVTKVDEIPVDDTLPDALYDMLEEIKAIYGEEGVKLLAEKVWKL
ncbi:MAG: hypothetical protein IKK52_04935 [Alphaproteobacteria bacterium]|nr:hypothetical protein [Alphaproteobacteria bacterium]